MGGNGTTPRLLLVGGGGGLVGRHVLREFLPTWRVRSVHRGPATEESGTPVEWVSADITSLPDWSPLLEGVDTVLNVAWYRTGGESRFRELCDGLLRLVEAARGAGVRRFLQVSVPPAPSHLEEHLPYLLYKRRLDRALAASGLSHQIVRPSMLFADHDVLLTVMRRVIRRYGLLPMFGDGQYHISPVAAEDLARVLRRSAEGDETGTTDLGGPVRYRYSELTDLIFRSVGRRARYWRMSPGNGVRLARLLEVFGSTLLYPYEVEWLVSDKLGLPRYEGLDRPLVRVETFLAARGTLRGAAGETSSTPPLLR